MRPGDDLPDDYEAWTPVADPRRRRRAGVLLHPTSLPGPHGIGDLGDEAIRFLDWLHSAGVSVWQVLDCSPTLSAFMFQYSFLWHLVVNSFSCYARVLLQ